MKLSEKRSLIWTGSFQSSAVGINKINLKNQDLIKPEDFVKKSVIEQNLSIKKIYINLISLNNQIESNFMIQKSHKLYFI